jgi:hypothetical protein
VACGVTFDYLRDEAPEAVERVLALGVHPEAKALASVVVIAAIVLLGAWAIGEFHVSKERSTLAQARAYLERSTVEANNVLARARRVRSWLSLDRRIRAIRISGSATARNIAFAANALPLDAWLTSIRYDPEGYSVTGRAVGLGGVERALHAYRTIRLTAVRSSGSNSARIVDFEARVSE